MTTQSNRALAHSKNGLWYVSSVLLLQSKARLRRFGRLARRKASNYLKDLPLLTSVWLARYMLWREIRRRQL
jgi:hypothetical protein